jgi:hypothetical protein
MTSLYGAITLSPTTQQTKLRDKKVKEAIEYLGDKYLLATPMEKLNGETVCK